MNDHEGTPLIVNRADLPFYAMAAGLVLLLFGLSSDYIGIGKKRGVGLEQIMLISGGSLLLLVAIGWDMLRGQQLTKAWLRKRVFDAGQLAQLAGIVLPLGVLIFAIRQFHLENQAFNNVVLTLTFAGFIIHYFLPDSFRLPFFLLLSLAGIITVMGLSSGAWLIGIGLALLIIANLPVRFAIRVALLIAAGVVLALMRTGVFAVPWSNAIWPILGSMFFIRLIIYVYDSKNPANRFSLWHSLSYFFLLPNVVFPLFPPVDYTNFRRGYFNQDQFVIYQKGLTWITWGTLCLLLYRFINYYWVITAEQVSSVATLAQYMVTTLLLYLRVIGQAYIILGICGLFGFNLPRPFNSMFLASSFTDFWRRANIYWKDLMQKVFFYPIFFALRGRGTTYALVIGTLINFMIAWFLHATQWFWLRGAFLTTLPDILFWSLLGAFVLYNVLSEAKKPPVPFAKQVGSTHGLLRLAVKVTGFFIAINLLWSMWTSPSLSEWLAVLSSVPWSAGDLLRLAGLLLILFGIFVSALWFEYRAKPVLIKRIQPQGGVSVGDFYRTSLILASVAVSVFLLGNPDVINQTDGSVNKMLNDMRVARLSDADARRLQRGYYEDLIGVNSFNTELWEVYMKRPKDWDHIRNSELVITTGDYREFVLRPSLRTIFHGSPLSTNSAGMRDREYPINKSPDTYRFAWIGASRTMGSGVNDQQSFEGLIEDRLNQEMAESPYARYESLNFSVGGYNVLQQLAALDRVWDYSPDALIYVPHPEAEKRKSLAFVLRMLDAGIAIPFTKLQQIVLRAGVTSGMTEIEVNRLLIPYGDELLNWAYGEIVAAARKNGAIPVWLNYPLLSPIRGRVEDIETLERIAKETGFVTINLSGVFDDYDRRSMVVAEWDFHPNPQGHQILADAIYAAFQKQWETIVIAR